MSGGGGGRAQNQLDSCSVYPALLEFVPIPILVSEMPPIQPKMLDQHRFSLSESVSVRKKMLVERLYWSPCNPILYYQIYGDKLGYNILRAVIFNIKTTVEMISGLVH